MQRPSKCQLETHQVRRRAPHDFHQHLLNHQLQSIRWMPPKTVLWIGSHVVEAVESKLGDVRLIQHQDKFHAILLTALLYKTRMVMFQP